MAETAICVYCRRHPMDTRFRPFCSDRCRMLDLGAWLEGRYRAEPAAGTDPDDDVPSGSMAGDDD